MQISKRDYLESMFCPRHVSTWCMSKQKRAFDLIVSVTALTLFSPVMLVIGGLIKVTSRGPALFRQERVGLHQRPFVILKFRTMKHCSDEEERGPTVTKHGDPRMTRFGSFLRRAKLDELPQLINVARGEMSLVGPRPKIAQHENLCMLCRPGITGAATIQFSHEEQLLTEVPVEYVEHYVTSVLNPEKCRLDSQYIETAHFKEDLRILARTVFKLSNGSRTTVRGRQVYSSTERTSMSRSAALDMSRVESMEQSPQEILRSA
jgi:lipopolysaccharide/colanic/teichoic acid biosynthesis glycosyltransferase